MHIPLGATKVPVNWTEDSSELYIEGYYVGGSQLRLDTERGKLSRAAIIFPIAYLYRHYFELRLKRLVSLSCDFLDEPLPLNLTNYHDLRIIWEVLKPLIPKFDMDFGEEEIILVEEAVGYIQDLDKSSTAFRYARDKKDAPSLEPLKVFDLAHLGIMMYDIHWALESLAF